MIGKLTLFGFIGLLALPSLAPDQMRTQTQPVNTISVDGKAYDDQFSPIALVTNLAEDLTGLCARQPVVCVQGARMADAALVRAEHGLRIAYAMVIEHRSKSQPQQS